jgi:hypothetical protein
MVLTRLAYTLRRSLCPPDVIVDVVQEDGKLFVTIENIGQGPAHNVSVSFDPELQGVRGTVQVSNLTLFKSLDFLPPGKEIRTLLDVTSAYFDRNEPTDISVTIHFESDDGTRLQRKLNHDLRIFRGTTSSSNQ